MKALPLILLTACSLPGGGSTTKVDVHYDRPGQDRHDSGSETDDADVSGDAGMPDVASEPDSGTEQDSSVPVPVQVGGAVCASCDATYDVTKGRCSEDPDSRDCANACLEEKTLRCVGGRCMAWEELTTPTLAAKCRDAGGVYKSIGPASTASIYLPSVCILECSP